MTRSSALTYAAIGVLGAETVTWAILLPWAHYRYTTGIPVGLDLWKPILLVGLVGGAIGLALFALRRAIRGS